MVMGRKARAALVCLVLVSRRERRAGRGSAGSAAGVGARGIRWGATVPDGAAQLRAEAGERPAVRRKKKETALSTAR